MHCISKFGSQTGQHSLVSWVTSNITSNLITFLACLVICAKQYLDLRYIVRIKEIMHLVLCFSHSRHSIRYRNCFLSLGHSLFSLRFSPSPPTSLSFFLILLSFFAILSLHLALHLCHVVIQPNKHTSVQWSHADTDKWQVQSNSKNCKHLSTT